MKHETMLWVALALLAAPAWADEPAQKKWAPGAHAEQSSGEAHHHGQPRSWTAYPLINRAMAKGMDERGSTVLLATKNFQPGRLTAYAPSGAAPYDLSPTLAGAQLDPLPKVGNYYWVTAREEQGDRVTVASTAYYFSNPGPAPTKTLLATKHELEIVPQPLPREHNGYRENEEWKFLLRYNGQPLPNQVVRLQTQNGSQASFTSDAEGIARVRFPADFAQGEEPKEGGGAHAQGPRRASFVLEAEHADNGKQYVTAFNYTYGPDAYATRSLGWGAGFALLGMALAAPLLRSRKAAKSENVKGA